MATEEDRQTAGVPTIRPGHMEAVAPLMLRLRRDFGGDRDRMPILAVIGERELARRACPREPRLARLGRTGVGGPARGGIDAHSLADGTGIPRETVRRKVSALAARGRVERDEAGGLHPSERAAADLGARIDATPTCLRRVADALATARAARLPATTRREASPRSPVRPASTLRSPRSRVSAGPGSGPAAGTGDVRRRQAR